MALITKDSSTRNEPNLAATTTPDDELSDQILLNDTEASIATEETPLLDVDAPAHLGPSTTAMALIRWVLTTITVLYILPLYFTMSFSRGGFTSPFFQQFDLWKELSKVLDKDRGILKYGPTLATVKDFFFELFKVFAHLVHYVKGSLIFYTDSGLSATESWAQIIQMIKDKGFIYSLIQGWQGFVDRPVVCLLHGSLANLLIGIAFCSAPRRRGSNLLVTWVKALTVMLIAIPLLYLITCLFGSNFVK